MAETPPSVIRPVTEMQRKLHQAADEQLAQVLALVDAMPERGAADALIAPLRARLATIEPPRPLSITRLLFRPLDPVIAGPCWKPGAPAVPRTALFGIGNAIIARLGPIAPPIQAIIAGHQGKDQAVVDQAGAELWPQGAAALTDLPLPVGWSSASGLPESCYPEIRANIAAVLHQAVPLSQRTQNAAVDPAAAVTAILSATQATHPAGLGIVLAVLLADNALAAPVLLAALKLPGLQVDLAVEQTLDRAEHILTAVLPAIGLAAASAQALHVAALLDAVEGPNARPALRSQAQRTRQLADLACQRRMNQALEQELLPKLAASSAVLDDTAITGLESVARGMRRLSQAGRRFGAGTTYDKLLRRTAAGACASKQSTLTRIERLRVAELLVGSDDALKLLPA